MFNLLQIVFDIFAALGFFVIIMRLSRAPKDDPRLSRGLQLLQSKISVIEDLSDRTETQVNQMGALLDQKSKEVQAKIRLAEQHVQEIRVSMQNSLEVAKIFQDKIPHQEIIERQNSMKYVQAARMAHQGMSADEIALKIDLPKGEIEFISKVNRDRLMFNEEQLPAWAKDPAGQSVRDIAGHAENSEASFSDTFDVNANAYGNANINTTAAATATANQTQSVSHIEPSSGFVSPNADGALSHLAFIPAEGNSMSDASDEQMRDTADRLRAEIEIAERQRLIENLSRLQFEMQSLDKQLAHETGGRDYSAAFEPPRTESESLQKIGEEFKKACEEANLEESRHRMSPPVNLASSKLERPDSVWDARVPQEPTQEPTQEIEKPRDPVLAKALAQAKVKAALRRSELQNKPSTSSPAGVSSGAPAGESSLAAARALAREMSLETQSLANVAFKSPVINGRPSQTAPVIRKVQFPKIESPQR